jgi:hypothetical protein
MKQRAECEACEVENNMSTNEKSQYGTTVQHSRTSLGDWIQKQ